MDEELDKILRLNFWHKDHPTNQGTSWRLNYHQANTEIMALIASYSREARIDEISGVQLEYGHYVAQTFVNGKAMTILDRIAKLKALGAKPEGKPNE